MDFKGWWRTRDGKRCEPLTIRDDWSRFVLDIRAMESTATDKVRPVFEEAFSRYGLPAVIRTDNGSPFASTRSLLRLTKLSAWWLALASWPVGLEFHNDAAKIWFADICLGITNPRFSTPLLSLEE